MEPRDGREFKIETDLERLESFCGGLEEVVDRDYSVDTVPRHDLEAYSTYNETKRAISAKHSRRSTKLCLAM